MADFVLTFDIPSVKDFIFATDVLREIQGASALLDEFNRLELPDVISAALPGAKRIYANGGAAEFVVSGHEPGAIEAACHKASRALSRRTAGGAQLVYGWGEIAGGGYQPARRAAHRRMGAMRHACYQSGACITAPFARECASLGRAPAVDFVDTYGEPRPEGSDKSLWACEVTRAKIQKTGRLRGKDDKDAQPWGLRHDWRERLGKAKFNETLGDSSEEGSGRQSYIGVIYADGNRMGALFDTIGDAQTLGRVSELVDHCTREATLQLMENNPYSAFPLLLGGDDLVLVMSARDAIDFSAALPTRFKTLTEAGLAVIKAETGAPLPDSLSLSVGVAIGRDRLPFHLLLDQAEQLLKMAKAEGAEAAEGEDPSRVDFHITTASSTLDVKRLRQRALIHGKGGAVYHPTCRPYTPKQLSVVIDLAKELHAAGFPSSRMNRLAEATRGPTLMNARLTALETLGNIRSPAHRHILLAGLGRLGIVDDPPFNHQRRSCFAELQEIYSLGGTHHAGA